MRWWIIMLCCTMLQAADLPVAQSGVQERHGSWQGQPFWLRLEQPEERFGGLRVLALLYSPPSADALAGTVLADTPFVLVDDHLRVRAWNERGRTATVAQYRSDLQPPAYVVQAEVHAGEAVQMRQRRQAVPESAWDRRLLPVLLLLLEREAAVCSVPVLDLFHLTDPGLGSLEIRGDEVRDGDRIYRLLRGRDGQVERITDATGAVIVEVGSLPPPEPLKGTVLSEEEIEAMMPAVPAP